ncbi:MAG: ion transporter, partial [Anaerolineae bacterium]|nr:ion transporter [Anaerolineae bacterium]
LNIDLPTDDSHSVGGLILKRLGRLPQPGSEITIGNVVLRVDAVEGRAVVEVHVTVDKGHVMMDEEDDA